MLRPPSYLLFVLAAIVALGPLSVDLYLPTMPSMVVFFDTQLSQVQLTLSSYLLGFALFHLLCGPLSDRFGRRPVLAAGMSIYIIASLACAWANSIEQLIIYRFLQAIGACCAPTLGRAVVRDIYPPKDAVKALAYVSSLMALAPVIAPSLGGILLSFGDWRLSFYVLAFAGCIALFLTIFVVPESLPHRQELRLKVVLKNYWGLIQNPTFMGCTLTAAFLYAGAFAFLSGASFVLIDFMQVQPHYFGFYFFAMVAGYIMGNLFTARVAHAWSPNILFKCGIASAFFASACLVLFCWLQWYQPLLIVLPMMFVTLGIGLVLPQSTALALQPFPHMAATASALIGFLQMGISALAGFIVGLMLVNEPMPMAMVIWGTNSLSAACYFLLLKKRVL